jgi:ubiquitin C-terminal hydrolase
MDIPHYNKAAARIQAPPTDSLQRRFVSPTQQQPSARGGSSSFRSEGLANLGNTCYLNAVTQALLAVPTFVNDLTSALWVAATLPDLKRAAAGARPDPAQAKVALYAALLRIVVLQRRKDHGVIDPRPLKKVIPPAHASSPLVRPSRPIGGLCQAMASYFRAYGSSGQQDAHEFLGDLLNSLQEELFPFARRLAAARLAAAPKAPTVEAGTATMGDRAGSDEGKALVPPRAARTAAPSQTTISHFYHPRDKPESSDDILGL